MYHFKILFVSVAIIGLALGYEQQQENQEDDHADWDASYNYQYSVQDEEHGDYKSHQEARSGKEVRGVYTVKQPDGRTRIVKYTVGPHTGFNAVVEYEGEATDHQGNQQQQYAAPNHGTHQTVHGLGQHEDFNNNAYAGYQELSDTSKFPSQAQTWSQPITTNQKKPISYEDANYFQAASNEDKTYVSTTKKPKQRGTKAPKTSHENSAALQSAPKIKWGAQGSTTPARVHNSVPKVMQYHSVPQAQTYVTHFTTPQPHTNLQYQLPSGLAQPFKLPNNQGWSFVSPSSTQTLKLPLPTQATLQSWPTTLNYQPTKTSNHQNDQMAILANLLETVKAHGTQQQEQNKGSAGNGQEKPVLFSPAPIQMIHSQQYAIPQPLLVNNNQYQTHLVQDINVPQPNANGYVGINHRK